MGSETTQPDDYRFLSALTDALGMGSGTTQPDDPRFLASFADALTDALRMGSGTTQPDDPRLLASFADALTDALGMGSGTTQLDDPRLLSALADAFGMKRVGNNRPSKLSQVNRRRNEQRGGRKRRVEEEIQQITPQLSKLNTEDLQRLLSLLEPEVETNHRLDLASVTSTEPTQSQMVGELRELSTEDDHKDHDKEHDNIETIAIVGCVMGGLAVLALAYMWYQRNKRRTHVANMNPNPSNFAGSMSSIHKMA
jgi:hypothetical protein